MWSPYQENIFVTVGVDCCIRIWDIRDRTKCIRIAKNAHDSDINVCSWNPKREHLIATGSDDKSFKVWDMRKFSQIKNTKSGKMKIIKSNDSNYPYAHYKWHTQPITAIEWSPFDESTLIVSSEDNQITIWDLSAEKEDTDPNKVNNIQLPENIQLPPQLMFVHGGQEDIKEVHFHPQIPNMIISTAGSGFHVFQPDNLMQSFENLTIS